jgi:hypothetical protein
MASPRHGAASKSPLPFGSTPRGLGTWAGRRPAVRYQRSSVCGVGCIARRPAGVDSVATEPTLAVCEDRSCLCRGRRRPSPGCHPRAPEHSLVRAGGWAVHAGSGIAVPPGKPLHGQAVIRRRQGGDAISNGYDPRKMYKSPNISFGAYTVGSLSPGGAKAPPISQSNGWTPVPSARPISPTRGRIGTRFLEIVEDTIPKWSR